jgi:predicted nuclease with TOPRIM domain
VNPSRWRVRARVIVTAVAVALLLVGLGGAGLTSYQNGRAWEERAGREAVRADAAERRAGELREQLDASEARVDDLQERMNDLADEKANAEDQREILRVYAKRYKELTDLAGGVSLDLSSCIAQLADAMSMLGNPYASPTYFDLAVSDCRTALDNSETLQQLIAEMPKPPES